MGDSAKQCQHTLGRSKKKEKKIYCDNILSLYNILLFLGRIGFIIICLINYFQAKMVEAEYNLAPERDDLIQNQEAFQVKSTDLYFYLQTRSPHL